MPYDKSEGSRRYNKEERGGWYCTNPKKHDEALLHHAVEEPHVHRAERNDVDPVRQPEARRSRPVHTKAEQPKVERPKSEQPKVEQSKMTYPTLSLPEDGNKNPSQLKKSGCGCVAFFMALPFIFALIGLCSEMGDSETNDNDFTYDESYSEDYFEYDNEEVDGDSTLNEDSVMLSPAEEDTL